MVTGPNSTPLGSTPVPPSDTSRPLRWYLLAQMVSMAGLGANLVVFPLLVLRYHSADALSATAVARTVGLFLGFFLAAWIVGRLGALRAAAWGHLAFMGCAALQGVVALTGAPVAWLCVSGCCIGMFMALDAPSRRSGIATLAGDRPATAQTWSSSASWTGRIAGAALGGVCWAIAPWFALLFNALSYLGPAFVFWHYRHLTPPRPGLGRPAPLRGLRAALGRPHARRALMASIAGGIVTDLGLMLPLLLAHRPHAGTAMAIGGLVVAGGAALAGVVASRLSWPPLRMLAAGWLLTAAGFAGVLSGGLLAVFAALAVTALGLTLANALGVTVLCELDEDVRADALALQGIIWWGSSAVAAPLLVAAAAHSTTAFVAVVALGCTLAAVAAAWPLRHASAPNPGGAGASTAATATTA